MSLIDNLKTRWNKISSFGDDYRLSCSHPVCSLSCANLKKGRISVTSVHGIERHSYEFTRDDMAFATVKFLSSLSKKELRDFFLVLQENLEK